MTEARQPGGRRQLLIQIDGLALPRLERAIASRETPVLASLVADRSNVLRPIYAGLPSTTPAVQGELFYGVRRVVPAFAFLEDRAVARHLLDPESADVVQTKLEQAGNAELLEGGSSYCNVFTGGARVARFCPAALSRSTHRLARGPAYRLRALAAYAGVALRSGIMLLGEIARLVRAPRAGATFGRRVHDAWDRILVSVAMRDDSRLAAIHDLRKGLPVVHVNFLGYDKLAHRYGPESAAAGRALAGIDAAIGTMLDALRTLDGDATAVVYADHGQEAVTSVHHRHDAWVEEIAADAVDGVLPDDSSRGDGDHPARRSVTEQVGERLLGVGVSHRADEAGRSVTTVESGPIAHVYLEHEVTADERRAVARAVATRAPGVAVLASDRDGGIVACHGDSEPMTIDELCAAHLVEHPFAEAIRAELAELARHPDAGDLVLLGTGFTAEPLTFADERGAHGGPGPLETHAFAIVPRRLGLEPARDGAPVRFADLRAALLADRSGGDGE